MALLPDNPENYDFPQLFAFAGNVLNYFIGLGGAVAVIAFIWGSIQYIIGSTGGDKEGKAAKGKTIVYYAVVGILVILLSRVIVRQVFNVIKPTPPDPATLPTDAQNLVPDTVDNSNSVPEGN